MDTRQVSPEGLVPRSRAASQAAAFSTSASASSRPSEQNDATSASRFRRMSRIPSWIRGRPTEPPASPPIIQTTPMPRRSAPNMLENTQPHPNILNLRIPPPPSTSPPSPPFHPRASRLSLGSGLLRLPEPRRQTTSFIGLKSSQNAAVLLRHRSVSTPSSDTPQPAPHKVKPRPAIVASSWDVDAEPARSQSLPQPHGGPVSPRAAQIVGPTSHPSSPSSTHATSFPSASETLHETSRNTTFPKLAFVSHFESLTQLNLKMESGEHLTAEELSRGLKYLFSRYHGVLDSVGAFKAQLDEENAGLRAHISLLQQQLQSNDAQLLKLRSLLADNGINARLSSDSCNTVREHSPSRSEADLSSKSGPPSSDPPSISDDQQNDSPGTYPATFGMLSHQHYSDDHPHAT